MIKPLLQITTTPAKYEYEVSRARLEISQQGPEVQRTTKRASLNMRQQAGRLEMNTVRRRSDMGFKGVVDRADHQANLGKQDAQAATGNYVELGNQMALANKGGNIPDALWSQTMQRLSAGDLVLVPLSPAEVHYVPSTLTAEFQPAEMSANWNIGRARLDFVPGTFSMNFTQYASINIEYLGDPIYAPPSANPNFEAMA